MSADRDRCGPAAANGGDPTTGDQSVSDDHSGSPVPGLSPANWAECEKRAISPEIAIEVGVRDCVDLDRDGFIVPYRLADGTVVLNAYRLTQAERDARTDGKRYHFPTGKTPPISVVLERGDGGPVALVEGTLQPLAVASCAPEWLSVHGMNGRDGWRHSDLTAYAGREVLPWPDGDVKTKRDIHDSIEALGQKLDECGAKAVRHVRMTTTSNEGANDYLAKIKDPAKRTPVIEQLIKIAGKLPRKPARKKKAVVRTGPSAAYFGEFGFLAEKFTRDVLNRAPAALTAEGKIATYGEGVFDASGEQFLMAAVELLGDDYRREYRTIAEEVALALLAEEGRRLPPRAGEPLVNLRNGMLDLRTGKLTEHSPDYLSAVQLPVEWDPDATCPTYERWLAEVIPEQIDDLEEVAGQMLDPSRTPSKALFGFGPARSGKSTFLRLLVALAGRHHSAVTLHQLSTNRFAAANVYGSIVNAAADLSSAHVEDLSIFKMMTGEDLINADRKYGRQFTFTNRALFAFSANELPTVGESSRAYSERIKPFRFGRSFVGRNILPGSAL